MAIDEGDELMSISSGSGLTEQLRLYFLKLIFFLDVSLEMQTNQTPGEAVSGRMNII